MNKYSSYKGKIVLITGANGGFGHKFIRNFLLSDAKVILTDISAKPIAKIFESENIPMSYEKNVLGNIAIDLSSKTGPLELYDACKKLGEVDVVIHNAGIAFGGYYEEVPFEKIELMLQVMLYAPMKITHLFAPDFLKRKSGQFVFLSSVAGFIPTAYGSTYSTIKTAISAFGLSLSGELNPRGVDVSIVYPFFTRTNILNSQAYGNSPAREMPAKFVGDPDEVIATTMEGINAKKLRIRPGFYSNFMYYLNRLKPLVGAQMRLSPQMKEKIFTEANPKK